MAAFLPAIASAATSALIGHLLSSGGTKQEPVQREAFQRQLIDQILQGVQGEGPFANLFQADQGVFQQSIVDPLLQQFQTQTAPGIQQRFIASGQQRGTPLETALARGGLNVQNDINKLFLPFQQGAQNRQSSAINQLLGLPSPGTQSSITPLGGALAGLQSSNAIPDLIQSLFGSSSNNQPAFPTASIGREGFSA